jgi:hypothetical protein
MRGLWKARRQFPDREVIAMFYQRLPIALLVGLALFPLTITGCATVESVKAEIPRQPPEVNVTGVWESSDWERCFLNQTDADVSGQLGSYRVNGMVAGKEVYLFLVDNGRVYHTLNLAAGTPGEMLGYYYYGLQTYAAMQPDSYVRRYPTAFHKTSDIAPPK